MPISPSQALEAMHRRAAQPETQPDLLIAGATGALGNAVMQRLVGTHRFAHTRVLAREPMSQGMRLVSLLQVAGEIKDWPQPLLRSSVALVMFEPPRMYHERERALWTPLPEQLPALAAWLKRSGVTTLAIALPHAQGSLPEALKRGLASLNEQALAAIGFERLIILRSAQKPVAQLVRHPLEKLAQWMLGIVNFMVPDSEQPVRPTRLAELMDALLQHAPLGISIVAQEQAWAWAQMSSAALEVSVQAWTGRDFEPQRPSAPST
jgi:hypothetical protein